MVCLSFLSEAPDDYIRRRRTVYTILSRPATGKNPPRKGVTSYDPAERLYFFRPRAAA